MASLTISSSIRLWSGRDIPCLGFGVYQITKTQTKESVLEALQAGYRHIDTAQLYRNEEEVGQAIKESGIPREQIYVTTKMQSGGKDYDSAVKAVDESLKQLNLDYIDLFLIHDPLAGKATRLDIWKALVNAKQSGKINDIGVSNFNVNHLEEIKASGLELPAINQIELHPLNQQRPIVDWCNKHGIVVEAYCPLIRGQFDNQVLQDLAQKYNKDPGQVLVRWSLQRGFVPLPRSSKPARIRSNSDVFGFELSGEDIARLDGLDKGSRGAVSWNPVDAD